MRVRLTPKSYKDTIDGIENTVDGPAFSARVRAQPSKGEANAAVEKLLAKWLGLAATRVNLVHGGKSRVKSFAVSGPKDDITNRLIDRLHALGQDMEPETK